jgi:hypothetical protein
MKLLAQFDIDTRSTRFTLVVTGIPSAYYVARYWNVPRRSDATGVGAVTQQWSGEVTSSSLDEAVSMARAQIESLDGPIIRKADGSTSSHTGATLKLAC